MPIRRDLAKKELTCAFEDTDPLFLAKTRLREITERRSWSLPRKKRGRYPQNIVDFFFCKKLEVTMIELVFLKSPLNIISLFVFVTLYLHQDRCINVIGCLITLPHLLTFTQTNT